MSATAFLAEHREKFWTVDRWGYKAPHPHTGEPTRFTRTTGYIGALKDTWGIHRWQLRLAVLGMAEHPELAVMALAERDDDSVLDGIAQEAQRYAGSAVAAEMGSALHKLIERHNDGEEQSLPPELARRIEQYQALLDAHGLTVVVTERIVCLPDLGVMGQLDMVLTERNGHPVVGDLKTGRDVEDFGGPDFSLQLGIYNHADYLLNDAGDGWEPMPEVEQDYAYVIHLPALGDGATLYRVDTAAGWETVQTLCGPVRDWRKRKDLLVAVEPEATPAPPADDARPVDPVPSPPSAGNGDRVGWISERLQALASNEQARSLVAQRWPEGVTVKPPWTGWQVDALASMLDAVEGMVGADFGASDPTTLADTPEPEPEPEQWELAPSWDVIDTGEAATDEDVTALASVVQHMSTEDQARLRGLMRDARAHGFSMDTRPMTQRQWTCARAAISVVRNTTDVIGVRALLGEVVALDEHWLEGAVIGALTIEQAEALADAADAPF